LCAETQSAVAHNAGSAGGPLVFAAGESSGDLIAAPVVQALSHWHPRPEMAGIAGDRMIAAGCAPWHHVRELSVRGYAEVLKALPRLLMMRRSLRRRVVKARARVFVGVDAPDFNLQLEAWLRASGVPTVHYVSPSIWAWRRERIELIRKAASHVLLIFPFEQTIYDQAGIPATYVGHPLAGQIPQQPDASEARRRLDMTLSGGVIALLPGSRDAEITYIAPLFLEAAASMHKSDATLRFVIPAATPSQRIRMQQMLHAWPQLAQKVTIFLGHSHDCLEAADGVLVGSGTATLEAALFKRPMVIAYRMPKVSWWLMKRRGYLPWIGLPNILAREFLVPEYLQDAAHPHIMAEALLKQLNENHSALRTRFEQIHMDLLRDTPQLAADAIMQTARV